jgi:hypothetical protein
MDSNDQDDIIKKVKEAGNDGNHDDDNSDDNSDDDRNDDNGGGADGDNVSNDFGGDISGGQGESNGGGEVSEGKNQVEIDNPTLYPDGWKEMDGIFMNPKKNNMFQPGSNDILNNDLKESKKSSIFAKSKIKSKLQETFNQEDMAEPSVLPTPVKTPTITPKTTPIAPSRKNKPFLPMPEVQPDPKAIKEAKTRDYEIYHKTLSSALDEARKFIVNRGYDNVEFTINDVQHVGYGHTERFYKEITKNGKAQNKTLNIQIYRMDNGTYELNMYIA